MVLLRYTDPLVALLVFVLTAATDIQFKTDSNLSPDGVEDVASRIIGGTKTTIQKFPWQVQLVINKIGIEGTSICGGSIISKTWIMSAAHCFTKGQGKEVDTRRIRIGAGITKSLSIYTDPDMQLNIINKNEFEDHLFIHPLYTKGTLYNNDIALIKLKNPLTFNKKVKPIALANENDFIPGKELITSGWGYIDNKGPSSNILHYVDGLKLLTREECKNGWNSVINTDHNVITNKMICHRTEGRNMCSGDSGGPVITGIGSSNGPPYVQIGINSWLCNGPDCNCETLTSAVFTDVTKFRKWIQKTISNCKAKLKCTRWGGECKDECDGDERLIRKGCKGKGCTCCAHQSQGRSARDKPRNVNEFVSQKKNECLINLQ